MWNTIKAVGKWFVGGGDTVEKVTDATLSTIDKAFYTEQEKAADDATIKEAKIKALAVLTDYQKATLPQNKARREIARLVSWVWAVCVVVLGVGIVGGFDWRSEFLDFTFKIIMPSFSVVTTFYFLKRMINP